MLERLWREQAKETLASGFEIDNVDTWRAKEDTSPPAGEGADANASQEDTEEAPPATYNLAAPRSRCHNCGTTIPWYLNIPVLSWLMLRGRCRFCSHPVSLRYLIVEILGVAIGVYAVVQGSVFTWGDMLPVVALFGFLMALLAMAAVDAESGLLPDVITLPTLWAGLVAAALGWSNLTPEQAILGAAVGYGAVWLLTSVFHLLSGRQGMGGGDWKMLAAIGAWVGVSFLPIVVLLASLIALAYALWRALRRADTSRVVRFGPALALGATLVIVLKQDLAQFQIFLSGIWL